MAFPTSVNDQITDSTTQSNVKVLGDAPAQAMGSIYQEMAAALGNAMQNAVSGQQQAGILSQAVTTLCVSKLVGTGSGS
ncbi:RebB family R body protein [Novosphingobium beihaiensis]|uniref:RebB family R body protein n=1 Tax=Novosphingobium beihaiensis TaxID=2930389 RepID=A0ABT0BKT6_9SPHN|nr:RebB family R body protein [Novosphingobium beihaiensis]MCJ2185354.1 RebB family R body protein [Novosphingobium beihaiensis]